MSPFAQAMLAYHQGDTGATFTVSRDDGLALLFPVARFFDDTHFSPWEEKVLSLCSGRVLDVGAGAGRHSLALQRQGCSVVALDIEPFCEQILKSRGVEEVVIGDVLEWSGQRFDKVLMLWNGIGMVGTPERLDRFLGKVPALLHPVG